MQTSTGKELPAKPLILCEHFLSVEGEGGWLGFPVTLIRFSGCNLRCTFCDTKFSSWFTNDQYVKSLDEVLAFIRAQGAYMVSFTGGEPMFREAPGEMDAFLELCIQLKQEGYYLKVETNGLIYDERFMPYIDLWSISPKLLGMGDSTTGKSKTFFDPKVLSQFVNGVSSPADMQLKWVVGERDKNNTYEADIKAIREYMDSEPRIADQAIPVILQPEGLCQSIEEYNLRCAHLCEKTILNDPNGWWTKYNLRILPQFHRQMWNNERQK